MERIDPESRLKSEYDISRDTLISSPNATNPNPNLPPSPEATSEEIRFGKAELQIFNHECIPINKVKKSVLSHMREAQGVINPELTSDTQVQGKLVLGLYLVADQNNYLETELTWFKSRNYEYVKTNDQTVRDSSFILVNTMTSHCFFLPDGTHVKIQGEAKPNGTIEICRWTLKDDEDKNWYSKVFQKGFDATGFPDGEKHWKEDDYTFYECNEGDPDRSLIWEQAKTKPPLVHHLNYTEFDPFAIFNPNLWTPHGFRRDQGGLSGGDARQEDRKIGETFGFDEVSSKTPQESNPCQSPDGCPEDNEYEESSTLKDMQNVDALDIDIIEINVGECVPLPVYDAKGCNCKVDNSRRLVEVILELEPEHDEPKDLPEPHVTLDDSDKPGEKKWGIYDLENRTVFPYYGNLDKFKGLSWKMKVLYDIAEIYSYLCMPFRKDFPYTVARVFGWYVLRAHSYGPEMGRDFEQDASAQGGNLTFPPGDATFDNWVNETNDWVIIQKELERCACAAKLENEGSGIKFQWEVAYEMDIFVEDNLPEFQTNDSVAPSSRKRLKRSADYYEKKILLPIERKFLFPDKTFHAVRHEGTQNFAREIIQEYKPKPDPADPRADAAKYFDEFPENVQHCWDPMLDQKSHDIVCKKAEEIFFFEDRAELVYELNIGIDLWWKIWSTVMGYCNKVHRARKSETFPRMYSSMLEHFFSLVMEEWKVPCDNEVLKVLLSEYVVEESQIWLDSCLEAGYIMSGSHSYRPPRPMMMEEGPGKLSSNLFEELPDFLYYRYHPLSLNLKKKRK